MQEETINPINVIRSAKRFDLKDVRNKHKEFILCNKRLRLHEVSENINDVTISEFKELLLKLKQKPVPVKLLKKIKNSCVSLNYIEALFRNEGAFNLLVRILIGCDAGKQLEAAACLTNLACGSHKCSYKVAKASGVYLISLVNGSSHFLQEQSVWTLANIANDCLECFNVVKSQGVLPALLKALMSPFSNVVQSVVFALNACTKYEDPEVISVIQKDLPKHLLQLIEQENIDKCVFLDAAFTLSNCCFLSVKYSLNIFDTDNIVRIINILLRIIQNREDNSVLVPLIRSIGFLSFNDKICEFLSSHSDFYGKIQLIASTECHEYLVKEAIWVLSNITASSTFTYNITDLIPLLDNLKTILKKNKSVTLQVLYYLAFLNSKNKCVSFQLMQHEIYLDIKSLLECEETDILEASRVCLEIIQQQKNAI